MFVAETLEECVDKFVRSWQSRSGGPSLVIGVCSKLNAEGEFAAAQAIPA